MNVALVGPSIPNSEIISLYINEKKFNSLGECSEIKIHNNIVEDRY